MKRRPLDQVDLNQSGVDSQHNPSAEQDDSKTSRKKRRSGLPPVKVPEVIELLDEEEDDEDAILIMGTTHDHGDVENVAQESLKRPKRNTVTKRIHAPPPSGTTAVASTSFASRSTTTISVAEAGAGAAAAPAVVSGTLTRAKGKGSKTPPSSSQGSAGPIDCEDIDKRRQHDPGYATVYARDAYEFLSDLQHRQHQPFKVTNSLLRERIVDWMVSVAEDFCMSSDVLFLSVSIYDRTPRNLRSDETAAKLVASVCMLLACKYEDVVAPSVDEFVNCLPNGHRKQIIEMEKVILSNLDYRLMMATAKPFLRRFQRAACVTVEEKMLGNLLAELTLVKAYFLRFTPSIVAAGAVYLARFILFHPQVCRRLPGDHSSDVSSLPPFWTPELKFYTGYDSEELMDIVHTLFAVFSTMMNHDAGLTAVIRKYRADPSWSHIQRCPLDAYGALLPPLTDKSVAEGG